MPFPPSSWAARFPRIASPSTIVACALFSLAAARAETPAIASRPLSAPAHRRGSTLFTRLDADAAGVHTENKYNDPKMWGDLYQEFEGGSLGTGVAVGDYDGDGRPDLFVVSKTESCRLFRNRGDWTFEDVTEAAGVADRGLDAAVWKNGVTFVDVNNDGRLDIYLCRFNAPNRLYLNQGNGTFKEAAHAYGLDIVDASVMACFCDYDRDGWLDVYLVTNALDSVAHPKGQRGYLLHNNRDGTFSNVTAGARIEGEAQSHSATWWDFDNDGWPDLYVANDYGVPDKLYRNNGDGTFTDVLDAVLPHTSHYSMGSDLGDVNNDGRIDLLVADMAATSHYKDQHSIAESRARLDDLPNPATAPKYMRSALYLNTGVGRCLEAAYLAGLAASDWTWSPRFEDFDNDGRIDLFLTNGFNRDPNPDVHDRSMRAETTQQRIKILRDSPVLVETHLAFRNEGDLTFRNVSAEWGLDERGVSFGSATGDFDGDGSLDLVYTNYERGVTLLRNDADKGHRAIFDLRGTTSNRFGVGAKITAESALGTQVRQLVLARGYMSSSEPALHFGFGADTAIRKLTVEWPSGMVQTFENLPVDQRYTITETGGVASPTSSRSAGVSPAPIGAGGTPVLRQDVAIRPAQFQECSSPLGLDLGAREEAIDELATQKLLPQRLNRRGPALAVGDIDGDGRDDLVLGGTTLEAARILRGTSNGFVAQHVGRGVAAEPSSSRRAGTARPTRASESDVDDGPVLLFDANGDGALDLLITKGGNSLPAGATEYQPRLWLNDGHGDFHAASSDALPPIATSAGAAVAADFDHDGRLDVFIGGRVLTGLYPQPPQSALLVNRGGKFEDVTDAVAPDLKFVGMVTSALWSDVDDDGWPDLLVTLEWGQVKYFHNNGGKQVEDWTEKSGFASAGTGWWTSIAAADFNGDGRMDYVVGNVGLNTQYRADAAHPALLYSGDFKGDGSTQLIEAYYEGDRLYPWRSRRTLAAAVPSLLKRFPTNESYARATLTDVFGAAKLEAAEKYEATELRSGVLLSRSDGTYAFEPLPRIGQIAPADGLVTGDFDGDGLADVYLLQNSYAPVPAVGRFDGGLSQLLSGDGHGHFRAVPVAESGCVVPGDAKALVAIDLDGDGWPDFVASRNNARTVAFRNGGVRGRHPLRVLLAGRAGNPTGIGARVVVEYADGTKATGEVYAGSGYYSQSAPAGWFGYTDATPAKRVVVRWPDGGTTEQAVAAGSTKLIVKR